MSEIMIAVLGVFILLSLWLYSTENVVVGVLWFGVLLVLFWWAFAVR